MAITVSNEYDHIDVVNGSNTNRHFIKDTRARTSLDESHDMDLLSIRSYPRHHGVITMGTSGTWGYLDPNGSTYDNYRHIIVPIHPGDVFKITAGARALYWLVLKDYDPAQGKSAVDEFADGYAERLELDPNDHTEELTAPSDAKYLFMMVNWGKDQSTGMLNDNYPASLVINGEDRCTKVADRFLAIDKDLTFKKDGRVSISWQSGGVSSLVAGATIKLTDNVKRQTGAHLCFDTDVAITTAEGYYAALAYVDDKDKILSSISNYRAFYNFVIRANTPFWIVLREGDGSGDISSLDASGVIAVLALSGNTKALEQHHPMKKWVALGDSITEGYYSYIPKWDDGLVAGVSDSGYSVGHHFYMDNVLYRTTVSVKNGDELIVGTNCVEATGEKPIGTYVNDSSKVWAAKASNILGWDLTNIGVGGTGYINNKNGTAGKDPSVQKRGYWVARNAAQNALFDDCDIVTIAYGCNDWKDNQDPLGTIDDPVDGDGEGNPLTIYGAIKATIEAILTANPLCRVIVLTPLNCLGYDHVYKDSERYGLTHRLSKSGTLEDVFQAIVNVCELYGIPYIDMTHKSPVNMLNIYDCLLDGVHPSEKAHSMIADYLSGALQGVYEGASPSHNDLRRAVEVSDILAQNTVSLDAVQQIAAAGRAAEVFEIGQTFVMPWTDKSTEKTYQVPVVLAHIGDAVDPDGATHHNAMYLQWLYAVPKSLKFYDATSGGSNNYAESNVKSWLNDADDGFLSGVTEEWKKVMMPVRVMSVGSDGTGTPLEQPVVADGTVFLPSEIEMYGTARVSVVDKYQQVEGPYWEYWKSATELDAPSNGTNTARVITRIGDTAQTAVTVMTRSANVNDITKNYIIQNNGSVTDAGAVTTARYVTPCFVIY